MGCTRLQDVVLMYLGACSQAEIQRQCSHNFEGFRWIENMYMQVQTAMTTCGGGADFCARGCQQVKSPQDRRGLRTACLQLCPSSIDCRQMVKLNKDQAHRRRFGRPLSWKEKIMYTMDMHATPQVWSTAWGPRATDIRLWLRVAMLSNSQNWILATSTWEMGDRQVSRAFRQRSSCLGTLQDDPRPERTKRLRKSLPCGMHP